MKHRATQRNIRCVPRVAFSHARLGPLLTRSALPLIFGHATATVGPIVMVSI